MWCTELSNEKLLAMEFALDGARKGRTDEGVWTVYEQLIDALEAEAEEELRQRGYVPNAPPREGVLISALGKNGVHIKIPETRFLSVEYIQQIVAQIVASEEEI